MTPPLLVVVAALSVVPAGPAGAQPPAPAGPPELGELPVAFTPPVGALVRSPASVTLLVPVQLDSLALETARLRLDGRDLTPLLLAFLATAGPGAVVPRF